MDSQTESGSALQRMASFVRRSPATATALLLILAAVAVTAVFTTIAAWVGFVDVPIGDYWRFVDKLGTFDEVFRRNNEHPIVIGQLAFWLDWQVFDARGRFLQILIFLTLAAQIPAFIWLASQACLKRSAVWVGGVAFAIILALNGFGNHSSVFQVSYVPGFTLAVWTFATFVAHARSGSKTALAVSALLSVIGIVSLASSVFVATLVMACALWLKRWLAAGVFAVVAIGGWLWMFGSPSTTASTGSVLSDHFPMIIQYFLAYFGSPFSGPNNPITHVWPDVDLAVRTGVIVDVLAGAALIYILLARRKEPALLALGGIIIFALLNAAASAVGRIVLGPWGALASHYHVNVSLLYVSLTIVAVDAASRLPPQARPALGSAAVAAAALLVAVLALRFPMMQKLPDYHREMVLAETALVTGVRDDVAVKAIASFQQMDEIYNGAERLRATGKWMFADPVARRVGDALKPDELPGQMCSAAEWSSTLSPEGVTRAKGTFARDSISRGARDVLITDAAGTVIGFGLVPRRTSDLNPLVQADGRSVDWIGHVRPEARPPFSAWLSTNTSVHCALGPAAASQQ